MRWEEHQERVGVGAKTRKNFKKVKMATVSSAASFNRGCKSIYISLNIEVFRHLSYIFFFFGIPIYSAFFLCFMSLLLEI